MGRAILCRLVLTVVACLSVSGGLAADPITVPVTRKAVDQKMAALVATIWRAANADGHWDYIPLKRADPPVVMPKNKDDIAALSSNRGGQTALMLLALKAAGEKEDDPRFQKALTWLSEQPWRGTYFRGLRAALYGQLKTVDYDRLLADDGKFLLDAMLAGDGTFSYFPPAAGTEPGKARGGDYSNTQYGILGLWAAADRGGAAGAAFNEKIPAKFWETVEKGYLDSQTPDGGWNYHYKGIGLDNTLMPSYGSMTVAALASLFVIWDKYYVANDPDCRGRVNKDLATAINRGLDWMGKHFSAENNPRHEKTYLFYYCYSIERVGVASGLKYFGRRDWFKEITWNCLNNRISPRTLDDAAWLLLFLSYGRAPVAFNKLSWGGADWNHHPRDLAGLCKYLDRTYETHHNWQIMPLEAAPDEFHDAPVLTVSGSGGGSLQLKPDEVAKLKTYLQRGGTLFAEAMIGDSGNFAASVTRLCQQMFPSLEMVRIPPDHPIYSCHARFAESQPELLGLSDGVRTMVFLSPRQIGCDWQRGGGAAPTNDRARAAFDLGDNLITYASDRGQLWSKEESYWPIDQHKKPELTVTIGRVVHGDVKAEHIWNPTGGAGWQRLDILSRNGNPAVSGSPGGAGGPGIVTTQCDLSQAAPVDPRRIPILHLTGVGPLNLTDEAKKNLRAYVSSGGLLLVDAAGGRQRFADSFAGQAETLFGGRLVPVTPDDLPFLSQVGEDGKVWYRHKGNFGVSRSLRPLEVLGIAAPAAGAAEPKRWNVLFLPYDMTYALIGAPALEPAGLEPKSAEQLVSALIAWRTGTSR